MPVLISVFGIHLLMSVSLLLVPNKRIEEDISIKLDDAQYASLFYFFFLILICKTLPCHLHDTQF